MYTRGGKSTVEKPTLVNKPKVYKGRLGEVGEANQLSKPLIISIDKKKLVYDEYFLIYQKTV